MHVVRAGLALGLMCIGLANAQMLLTSPAFTNFGTIPPVYGCDIETRDSYRPSVPLSWDRPPAKVQSFFLIMDDMDANEFVHWVVKDLPPETNSLSMDASETNMPPTCVELPNSEGVDSYSGPCPMNAEHNYRFRLYALSKTNAEIKVEGDPASFRADYYISQIEDDVLYVSVLVGKFYQGYVPENITRQAPDTMRRIDWSKTVTSSRNVTEHSRNGTRYHIVHDTKTINGHRYERVPGERTVEGPFESARGEARTWHEREAAVLHRYVKPSEVIRSPRPHNDLSVGEPCAKGTLPEVVSLQQAQSSSGWCETADTHGDRAGLRYINQETERCTLRTRVPDSSCQSRMMPRQFACEQPNQAVGGLSPSLVWKDVPAGTASLAVMMEDATPQPGREAESGDVHWLVVNIPTSTDYLESGASASNMPPLSTELRNSFNATGYSAPCPPVERQRTYRIHLFAMPRPTTKVFLPPSFVASDVTKQLHKLALCTAVTEMTFSYAFSAITPTEFMFKPVVASAGDGTVIPGEIQ